MNLFRLCVANLVALFWVVIPTAMGANIIPQLYLADLAQKLVGR